MVAKTFQYSNLEPSNQSHFSIEPELVETKRWLVSVGESAYAETRSNLLSRSLRTRSDVEVA